MTIEISKLFKVHRLYHSILCEPRFYVDIQIDDDLKLGYEKQSKVDFELVMRTADINKDIVKELVPKFFSESVYVYSNYYFDVTLTQPVQVKASVKSDNIKEDMIACLDMNYFIHEMYSFLRDRFTREIELLAERTSKLWTLRDQFNLYIG